MNETHHVLRKDVIRNHVVHNNVIRNLVILTSVRISAMLRDGLGTYSYKRTSPESLN